MKKLLFVLFCVMLSACSQPVSVEPETISKEVQEELMNRISDLIGNHVETTGKMYDIKIDRSGKYIINLSLFNGKFNNLTQCKVDYKRVAMWIHSDEELWNNISELNVYFCEPNYNNYKILHSGISKRMPFELSDLNSNFEEVVSLH